MLRLPKSGVYQNRNFLRLWAAQVISALGSRVTRTALPIIAVLSIDASPMSMALLAVLSVGPGVIVGLLMGGVVDRSRKRRLLIAADIVRAVAVATLPVAAWLTSITLVHVFAVAAIVGAATALFQITDNAYLPALVGREHVIQGNSALEATEAVAEVTGPGIAGILIQILGAPLAVLLDAASYLWSAIFLTRIDKVEQPIAKDASTSVARDIADGFRVSWNHPQVRPILLADAAMTFFGGFFFALYMLFCLDTLDLEPATIGLIIGVGGIGAFFGAWRAGAMAARFGWGKALIIAGFIGEAGQLLIPAAAGPYWLVLVLLVLHQLIADGFDTMFRVQSVSLRQTVLPLSMLGRSNAAFQAIEGATLPVGAVCAGLLAELIGVREALWIGMSIGVLSPLLLLPLRHLRGTPQAPPDEPATSPAGAGTE